MAMAVESQWESNHMKGQLEDTFLSVRRPATSIINYMPAMNSFRLLCFSSWFMLREREIVVTNYIVIRLL